MYFYYKSSSDNFDNDYYIRKLKSEFPTIEFDFWAENFIRRESNQLQNHLTLEPTLAQIVDEYSSSYLSQISFQDPIIRRVDARTEELFTDFSSRKIVENIFLKYGSQLVLNAKNPAESMRPLGFNKLPSMGFGAMFFTYRNIPNNCPLVLWYGDPTKPNWHPLSKWYPLFQRRVNSNLNNSHSNRSQHSRNIIL